MSGYRGKEWARISKQLRPRYEAMLPLPCANHCKMGGLVLPGQKWDLAHIVDLAKGGTNTAENLGVAHRYCNRSDGGTEGANKINKRKTQTRQEDRRHSKW